MKKIKIILDAIASCIPWLIAIGFLNLAFIFFAWIAYPAQLHSLALLMAFVSGAILVVPVLLHIHRQHKASQAFSDFLLEPDEAGEYQLLESVPRSLHPYVRLLGEHLRNARGALDEQTTMVEDYETYIENWAHEIKKPLALMTLLLDNRKDEMSPLVRQRLIHVRDQTRLNVEQVLYFSRLKNSHKDYYWEPLPLLRLCREAVRDNHSLLDEAGFHVLFHGDDVCAVTDKRGLMFILSQFIANSIKYPPQDEPPAIDFSIRTDPASGKICLSVKDNGPGIPPSDLSFIFDKGFSGDRGSYLNRSTGMGLYLVQKMASDLAIELKVRSESGRGAEFLLIFPPV